MATNFLNQRSKYGARKVEADGIVFDSKAEHRRYEELRLLQLAGEIRNLQVHPELVLYVPVNEGHDFSKDGYKTVLTEKIGVYHPDFYYEKRPRWIPVWEDVKSSPTRTTAYRLRKKMVESIYCIKIMEVEM